MSEKDEPNSCAGRESEAAGSSTRNPLHARVTSRRKWEQDDQAFIADNTSTAGIYQAWDELTHKNAGPACASKLLGTNCLFCCIPA